MTVSDCLLTETKAKDLVLFRDAMYWIGTTFVDYEDLFMRSLNSQFIQQNVLKFGYEYIDEFKRKVFVIDIK